MNTTTLRALAEEIVLASGVEVTQLNIEIYRLRVLHFRQLLLKREYEKTLVWNPSTIQAFDIELKKVKKFGTVMYMSDVLPITLSVKEFKFPFISVGNRLLDENRKFYDYVKPEQLEFLKYRKFSKLSDHYTYENGRIYSLHEGLRVRSVFENPLEVVEFSKEQDLKLACGGSTLEDDCFKDDDIELEQTMAAAILTFFGNNSTRQNDRTPRTRRSEEDQD